MQGSTPRKRLRWNVLDSNLAICDFSRLFTCGLHLFASFSERVHVSAKHEAYVQRTAPPLRKGNDRKRKRHGACGKGTLFRAWSFPLAQYC